MFDQQELLGELATLRSRVAGLEAELAARPKFDRSPMLGLLNVLPMLVGAVDLEGRSEYLSPAFRPWLLDPDGITLAVPLVDLFIPSLRPVVSELFAAAFDGEMVRRDVTLPDRDGVLRDLQLTAMARKIGPAGISGVVFVGHDTTHQREATEALAASERRLTLATEAAGLGVWDLDLVTNTMVYSDRARAICGFPADGEITFDMVVAATHPEDLPRTMPMFQRALDPALKEKAAYEYRVVRPDGELRWVVAHGEALFEARDGVETAVRYVGTLQDVTERTLAAQRQQLLMHELNHRVKNTLASVQSIAALSLRPGVDTMEARSRLTDRLVALAGAHDILTRENWEAAELGDVVAAAIAPFYADRFDVRGAPTRIPPRAAVALALALHELTTNAVKYGALSQDGGRVSIAWGTEAETPDGPLLVLDWAESGGPPVSPPTRSGFGARLLSQGLATEFGAGAQLDYRPEGVVCRIEAPLRAVDPLELG